jgi:hypothetical protein
MQEIKVFLCLRLTRASQQRSRGSQNDEPSGHCPSLARLFNRANESDCNGPVLQVWPREYDQSDPCRKDRFWPKADLFLILSGQAVALSRKGFECC